MKIYCVVFSLRDGEREGQRAAAGWEAEHWRIEVHTRTIIIILREIDTNRYFACENALRFKLWRTNFSETIQYEAHACEQLWNELEARRTFRLHWERHSLHLIVFIRLVRVNKPEQAKRNDGKENGILSVCYCQLCLRRLSCQSAAFSDNTTNRFKSDAKKLENE